MARRVKCVTEVRVRYGETDQMGVVYHAEYLVYCEIGRTEMIRALGMPYAELERKGVMLAVTDATLRYHAPARYDDRLTVETTLSDVRSRSVTFDYCISSAETGARLVTASTRLMAMDTSGRLVALPLDLRDCMARAINPGR